MISSYTSFYLVAKDKSGSNQYNSPLPSLKATSMEKFVVLPFSFRCASQSSVDVLGTSNDKNIKISAQQSRDPAAAAAVASRSAEEVMPIKAKVKHSSGGFLVLPKPKLARAIHRLIKGIKRISQFFVYEDIDDTKTEMEIGYPTDVKHVTHIGLDGSSTMKPVKGWENPKPPEVISFSAISIKQFELAMAAQAHSSLSL